MAYTNEVPWHGLGHYVKDAPDVPTMLELAQLNWTVERRPLYLANTSESIPDFAALTRSSDNKVLDIVGSRYIPAQNADTFKFFDEFVRAGDATMETAGSINEGRYVWGLASLKSSFKLPGNDVVNGYLLIANPHEQGKSLIVKFTPIRVVCNNTLTLALKNKGNEFRMSHRRMFTEQTIVDAKEVLGIAREQLGEFESNARKLHKLKLKEEDVIRILAPVYQPTIEPEALIENRDKTSARFATVLDVLKNAPGAQPGTGWGVLNAVTYYSDHIASRSPDRRLTNAWLGKTAAHKEQVLSTLLDMAA